MSAPGLYEVVNVISNDLSAAERSLEDLRDSVNDLYLLAKIQAETVHALSLRVSALEAANNDD